MYLTKSLSEKEIITAFNVLINNEKLNFKDNHLLI